MKKVVVSIILLISSTVLAKDLLFAKGFPSTHDGGNHLARIANYYIALKEGQIPPRFAPNLEAGLGYTSLNFNYPLANILSVPLVIANISIENSLKLIFFLSIASSSIGMYLYLKTRFSLQSALLGSLIYTTSPYFLANIYIRGNIGESLAFGLLPWVMYTAVCSKKTPYKQVKYTISLALLLLSHNLIALLSLPLIALLLWQEHESRKEFKELAKSTVVAILLVSFFWIPALLEKKFITLESSTLSTTQLHNHFVRLDQLISSAWDHGYSYAFPVDGMNFSLGVVIWVALVLYIPISLARKRINSYEATVFGVLLFTIFCITETSKFIWQLVPYLGIIQFPWRLLFFAVFLGSILVASITQKAKNIIIPITVLALLWVVRTPLGIQYATNSDEYWFSFPMNTTILNENDPIWFDRTKALLLKDHYPKNPIIATATYSAQIVSWNGSYRKYIISTQENTVVTEKTMYFPGWETTINGKSVSLWETKERQAGLINFDVPAGENTIITKFTQKTYARILGNSASIIGTILLAYQIKRKK